MYQPACYQCRVEAGNDLAGVKEESLCVPHLKQHCADLTRQLAEAREEIARLRKALEYYRYRGDRPHIAKAALEASDV